MDDDNKWHLDRKVSIGHIVTTALALVAAILAYANIETRVAVLESRTSTIREDFRDIKDTLRRIEEKLEGKADKR